MGRCISCGKETGCTASVYIGEKSYNRATGMYRYDYSRRDGYACEACVRKYANANNKYSLLFYLGLQLLWLSVLKQGFSVLGVVYALLAGYALFRLALVLLRMLLVRRNPQAELPRLLRASAGVENDASALFKSEIEEEEKSQGHRVRTLKEQKNSQ